MRQLVLATMLFAAAIPAWPEEAATRVRLCIGDVEYPPYTLRNGKGTLQNLVNRAAAAANANIEWHWQPVRRCNEGLRTGTIDASITGIYPDMAPFIAYPTRDGKPDDDFALANARFIVYRRIGSALEWNGEDMAGLGHGAVGFYSGFAVIADKLKRLGIRYDDGAKSLELNLEKLVHGRLEAVIAMEEEAQPLVNSRYAAKVEALVTPFSSVHGYLVFSKAFHAAHADLTQEIWRAMQKAR